jgi:UDP:flavonoid glycosyltransferase YjiC (YdhE family)
MTAQRPVLIMAGGTGGHIFPGLAVAECLRAQGVPVVWLGAVGGMETKVVPAQRIELHTVAVGGLRGKGLKTRLLAPLMLLRALFASLAVLRQVRPRSVLSMGGYVAFGVSLMLAMQAFVSVGVNLGALPTKGLTLPLISYGGSSMVLTCAMAGVLLRATYEINRALDARQMATRMPVAVAAADANAVATSREAVIA